MRVLPKPYPDELVYSVLARMAYHYGYWSPKELLNCFYGRSGVLAVPDLPSNLTELARATDEVWHLSPDELAIRHTLIGYYTHFQGARARTDAIARMRSKVGFLHLRLGICAGSAVSPTRFQLCAMCRAENIQQYGESYWHRSHHLPGVLTCAQHGEVLLQSEISFRPLGRHEHVAAPREASSDGLRPVVAALDRPEASRLIAVRSANLLDGPAGIGNELPDYTAALKACGFTGGRGGEARLRVAFVDYFGGDLLAASFRAEPGRKLQWLGEVLRAPRRPMHPYRHVLMQVFLDASANVQRNIAAEEQGDSRRWSLYRDEALRREADVMAQQGFRTHAIARALDVDWKTAARLIAPIGELKAVATRDIGAEREAWTALACMNPSAGKKALREMAPAAYARLYRNDRVWLLAFRAKRVTPSVPRARVDWQARDVELEERVRVQAAAVLTEVPLRRVSRSYVLGALSARALLAHEDMHLPRTVRALDKLCESVEAFQVRRLVSVLGRQGPGRGIADSRALWEARIGSSRLVDGGAGLLALARAQIAGATGNKRGDYGR